MADSARRQESRHLLREVDSTPCTPRDGFHGTINKEDLPKLAASKASKILQMMEEQGYCELEQESIYGAAMALPQIARSAGWPVTFTTLAFRSYFFTLLSFLVQGFLLSMIGEEQHVIYPFAGQMHLCDFGASMSQQTAEPSNCIGPGGTTYSPSRLYSYNTWSTRNFVRESLKTILPEKAQMIDENVDPGEYGLESYHCRIVCIFIFLLSVVHDLNVTFQVVRTLWFVPTSAESWITYYSLPRGASKEDIKNSKGWNELDMVQFSIAGIPAHWKLFNVVFILLPKFGLWLGVAKSGVHYLMETDDIVDLIVNCMALAFVLNMDELIFSRFATSLTKHIMGKLTKTPLFDIQPIENESDEQALERFDFEELGHHVSYFWLSMPRRFAFVVLLQALLMWDYYYHNCTQHADGSWISKDVFLPKDLTYRPLALMFGWVPTSSTTPIWTMPQAPGSET
ncbi:rnf111 [Symbiodinium natans]|uniref:Rnf111 protein n=1 Tax=Symbiodinium natans TaxID=878477 RepID=A0A812UDP0_9DINO|nr:rnf111 [Symbiodinium natans]